ncbi:MAG: hypothetical protein ABIO79_10695 [Ferruginibacter sp.]
MEKLWCWRCKMEVGMLNEEEFTIASKLYSNMFNRDGSPDLKTRSKPLLDYYKSVTGEDESNPNAVMHHGIDQYGPPCEKCGKPYRTPQASFCAACGNKRS